jgi:hypothetical protein
MPVIGSNETLKPIVKLPFLATELPFHPQNYKDIKEDLPSHYSSTHVPSTFLSVQRSSFKTY